MSYSYDGFGAVSADAFEIYKCLMSKANQAGGGDPIDPVNTPQSVWVAVMNQIGKACGLPDGAYLKDVIAAYVSGGKDSADAEIAARYGVASPTAVDNLVKLLTGTGCYGTSVTAPAPSASAPATTATPTALPTGAALQAIVSSIRTQAARTMTSPALQAAAQEVKLTYSMSELARLKAAQAAAATTPPLAPGAVAAKGNSNALILGGAALLALLLLR